ncbi:MAG: tetratricopeptide repeat protein [Candidatus Eisenbacteria bacterium]|uniref:Tetratricopeptide repeat protein n=1 Tax=Eiseniibacteriota bacterium TaxID=2212470 RepID=A0A948W5M0_UNCEI|nr:tetratricopeptide repeat protein [Candidatus Eisenbacteria bacterium]MBU1949496.1 tetratricopeptide repeat protein [Candidatus Eisenbacteria bacterium]MBU2689726.1 tetratricopeptide repeat protein [Candidatus Eisenbacteria bacterium]
MDKANRRWIPWLGVLLAAAAVIPFLSTLGHDFTWDDHTIIERNPGTDPGTPLAESLLAPYWPPPRESGLYRPIPILTYRLGRTLWGLHPAGFHALNILLHLLTTLALFRLLLYLFSSKDLFPAAAASFLFAVHPLHTEAIAGIVGTSELWAALWGILAAFFWIRASRKAPRYTLLLAWLCWILALASKESSAGWLLIGLAYRIGLLPRMEGSTIRSRRFLDTGMVLIFFGFLLLRAHVLGSIIGLSPPSLVDNPLVNLSLIERIPAAAGLWLKGFFRLLWPFHLMPDASFAQTRPAITLPLDIIATALLLGITLTAMFRGRRGELWAWGWIAGIATQSLTMNILFPIGTCYAERLFYTPSAGYLVALVSLAAAAGRRFHLPTPTLRHPALWIPVAGWVILLGVLSHRQARIWADDLTLFQYAARVAPKSVKAQTNLAVQEWHREDLDAAEKSVRRALEIKADYPAADLLMARIENKRGEQEGALQRVRETLATEPQYMEGWVFLGGLYIERDELAEALSAYTRAHQIDPGAIDPRVGIASAYAGLKRWSEALPWWEEAHRLDPGRQDLLYPYGVTLWREGRPDEAQVIWREALAGGNRDPEMLNDFAWLLLERKQDLEMAEGMAREAVRERDDPNFVDTLVRLLVARGRAAAADSLVRAAESSGIGPEWTGRWKDLLTAPPR